MAVALTVIGAASTAARATSSGNASSGNIVVNSSFEIPLQFNGTKLRQFPDGDAPYLASSLAGSARAWTPTDAQGWLVEGGDATGVAIVTDSPHSGRRCLRIKAPADQGRSVISSFESRVGAGPVTLTAWVKTDGADATISLDLVTDWSQAWHRSATVRQSITLPPRSLGWRSITMTAQSPSALGAVCRLTATRGTAWIDDVEITNAPTPAPFNVRPQEFYRVGSTGIDSGALPEIIQGSARPLSVTLGNDSRLPVDGQLSLWFGRWNAPHEKRLAAFAAAAFPPGAIRTFALPVAASPPDAYVVSVTLTDHGSTLLDSAADFHPLACSGGAVANGSLSSDGVLRLIVTPAIQPQDLFGVSNGMLGAGSLKGSWYGGYSPQDCLDAAALGIRCGRGHFSDDVAYQYAMGKMLFHATNLDDGPGPFGSIDELAGDADTSGVNPADPAHLDLSSPIGIARLQQRAQTTGRWFAQHPIVASYQMANETPLLNSGHLCPSIYADADFRDWCRARYRSIATANAHWGTHYASWNEVAQIVSAQFLDQVRQQPQPTGAAAIDWTASAGRLSDSVVKRMQANPGQSMDWMRWRTAVTLRSYEMFRSEAKRYSPRTLYSTNLCWPDFFPEMAMPFYRAMDVTMLDICYTAGMARTLGNPFEMMDGMEMAESNAPDKPIWGIEVYDQPQHPAEFMALQNWGLLAHGMSNNLVFDWCPYSDAGAVKEPHAWEKPDAPPMWMIIDQDGTRLPAYYTYKRSLDEIHSYDARFHGLAVKRAPTDVALYVSLDTAQYVEMQTGNKPWLSPWQLTRNNLIYLLRMNGVSVNYVDDETLPDTPGRIRKIVVPAAYVLSQSSASKLARFARLGGTVALAGMSGVCDPWLRKYSTIGGSAWADLHWTASDFTTDRTLVSFHAPFGGGRVDNAIPEENIFLGVNPGKMPGASPIQDVNGTVIGWQRPWGKGKLVAYGVFPARYTGDPHVTPNMAAWARQLIALADLPLAGRWIADGPSEAGLAGTGSPVVEVVVRQKSAADRFVFCLNQGGSGSGKVEVAVGPGVWTAVDVITGRTVARATLANGKWRAPLHLAAFGYAVIRLVRS